MALKYWPLICSALVRKPAEGLLTFLAVAAGFTLLSLMISMNLASHDILNHSRADLLIVDSRFYNPSGPQGLPLAYGEQIARMAAVRAVAPFRWLGGYHADPHQGLSVRLVDASFPGMWSTGPIGPAEWNLLFASPTGILVSAKAAAKWSIKPGAVFTLTTQPGTRADGATTWAFNVLAIVPDDLNHSGSIGFIMQAAFAAGAAEVAAETYPSLLRSIRVMEKSGMALEGPG